MPVATSFSISSAQSIDVGSSVFDQPLMRNRTDIPPPPPPPPPASRGFFTAIRTKRPSSSSCCIACCLSIKISSPFPLRSLIHISGPIRTRRTPFSRSASSSASTSPPFFTTATFSVCIPGPARDCVVITTLYRRRTTVTAAGADGALREASPSCGATVAAATGSPTSCAPWRA